MLRKIALIVLAQLAISPVWADDAGDPIRGAQVYKKCASCHMIGEDARARVGPALNDIVMAKAGSAEGFRYSKALQSAAAGGLEWTPDMLAAFLENPKAVIPKTKMSFRGLKAEADRLDVIAYLRSFSKGDVVGSSPETFSVSAEVLGIEGDIGYGEYLSSECTTCHQTNGANEGIPAIIGWETGDFVTAMHAYKTKHRDNPVMQMITGRLADDEIAALAAFFKSLDN